MRRSVVFVTLLVAAAGVKTHAATRYVSPFGSHIPPFIDWTSAATNIEDAIVSASAGDVIVVTNGVYSSGGKVMAGTLTNRVVIDKPITVQSINGAFVTTILGRTARDPGPVRGAWLTNGATLSGFSILYGRTLTSGDQTILQ